MSPEPLTNVGVYGFTSSRILSTPKLTAWSTTLEVAHEFTLICGLLTIDHLDDVLAGLAFLKRVASVDTGPIVVGGHSTGGQLTLLALERDKSARAAVVFSPAARTWQGSPELQDRLLAAAREHRDTNLSDAPGE